MASVNPEPTKNGIKTLKTHWDNDGKPFCGISSRSGMGHLREKDLTQNADEVTCKSCLRKVGRQGFYDYDSAKNKKRRLTQKEINDYAVPIPTKEMIAAATQLGDQLKREAEYVR